MPGVAHLAIGGIDTRPPGTVAAAGHWFVPSDRIGPLVYKRLAGRLPGEVELVDLGTGGLAMLDFLRGQDFFLVVDASSGLAAPGTVSVTEPGLEMPSSRGVSVHQIGPREVLAIAAALYPEKLPRKRVLVLVETGAPGEFSEDRVVTEAADTVLSEVYSWLETRQNSNAPEPPIGGGRHDD